MFVVKNYLMAILPVAVSSFFTNFGRRLLGGSFFNRPSFLLGQSGPVWIDTLNPYELYNTIPQLKLVINKKATMFSNMHLKLVDASTGEEIEDVELKKLLDNPNCLQSQNDFLRQFKEQEQVYGNQFIYKNKPSDLTEYPIALWNISPAHIQPVLSGKMFEQVDAKGIITKYLYRLLTIQREFKTEEILYSRINDLDNPIIGCSAIRSLKFPLSNIEAAYEYRNVVMKKKGALGMLSNNSKDGMGSIPVNPTEKKRIEDNYVNSYGISKDQSAVILTDATLTWTPMTFPTREMMLFEEVDANTLTLADAFGLNINIFSNKSSTFENVKNSIIQCYQDTIIPEADQFTQSLGKFIGIPEGTKLKASYDHLSIMKENKLKGMAAIQAIVSSLTQAVQAGLMSPKDAKIILANELNLSADAY